MAVQEDLVVLVQHTWLLVDKFRFFGLLGLFQHVYETVGLRRAVRHDAEEAFFFERMQKAVIGHRSA